MGRDFYDGSVTKLAVVLAITAWICALSAVAMVFQLHPRQQGGPADVSVIPRHLVDKVGGGKEAALMSQ
jgi:hypothetical protein